MTKLINPLSGESSIVPELAPKRGRPAKNAPVYDDDNNLIITSEERETINEIVEDIRHTEKKVEALMVSAAQNYFNLGEILERASKKATCSMTAAKYEAKTGIPARMVSTAFKIYKEFADNPEGLNGLTMREIAMRIGEKKESDEGETSPVQYNLPEGQLEYSNEFDFGLPTLSGIELTNYRLHADTKSGNFFLLSKKDKLPIPVGGLTVDQPHNETMKAAYNELLDQTQCALERYYALIEQGGNE
ncbi:MAG: hypothetical protein J6J00_02680 [Treponema sp.]|nr:hypothetical protein [Treponema sp.]